MTSYTDGDGMVIIRVALPPQTAKPILAAVDDLVTQIAQTPMSPKRPPSRPRTTPNNPPCVRRSHPPHQ